MKYSDSNKPLVCMQTQSSCYKRTGKMAIKGVLWHSTGANNPNLKRYVQPSDNDPNYQTLINLLGKNVNRNDLNHIDYQTGLNCWIGKLADGTVTTVQTLPWNYRPWGCGAGNRGSCNNGWIQFEICEDNLASKDYFDKVYKEACEITAYLCKLYNIDPHGTVNYNGVKVPTILCHQDSYKLGLGTGHADVMHWFPKFGKTMEDARNDVANLLGKPATVPDIIKTKYQVKVTANDGLNCRTTNSVSGSIVKTYPVDTILTIFKENNNWGYTGEGWVSLAYTSKIVPQTPAPIKVEQPSAWTKDALSWAQKNGLMVGDDKGNMMPKKSVTREELAVILQRFEKILSK